MADKPDPNDLLDKIVAGNKAKADAKKAPKPNKMDGIRLRKGKGGRQKDPETGLNDQQERFCREYLVDFNATQAAIRAGYSQKTAYSIASEILKKPEVQARLGQLQKPALEVLEVTTERIMSEVAKIAFSNMGDFLTIHDDGTASIDLRKVSRDQMAALEQYEVIELPPSKMVENGEEVVREVLKIKIKQHSKLDALEKLMRRHNLVKPMEVNVNHSGKVTYDLPEFARRMAFVLAKAAKTGNNAGKGGANAPTDTQRGQSGGPAV